MGRVDRRVCAGNRRRAGSLGGIALLGAGEWVYRKINVVAAASLFGAGIAVFFLVSYAGNAFYGLDGRDGAFVLMVDPPARTARIELEARLTRRRALFSAWTRLFREMLRP